MGLLIRRYGPHELSRTVVPKILHLAAAVGPTPFEVSFRTVVPTGCRSLEALQGGPVFGIKKLLVVLGRSLRNPY